MKKNFLFSGLCLAVLFTGCSCTDIPIEEDGCADFMAAPKAKSASNGARYSSPMPAKSMAAESNALSKGNFDAPEGRKMTFTADISISVLEAKKAVASAREMVKAAGGYVKSLNNTMMTLAVPVANADDFLNKLAELGEVSNLRIDGNDVTEQVQDLKIRMDNLEKSRQRLLLLMDRTAKVSDLTQVERELNRVTTELERLQATDKNLANRISFVTITVRFQTKTPAVVTPSATTPITWINDLGKRLQDWVVVRRAEQKLPFKMTLPEKFIFAGGEYAVSGNNCVLRFREVPNAVTAIRWYGDKYAGVQFYSDMILDALKTRLGGEVVRTERKIDGKDALSFRGETTIGNIRYVYLVAVAVDGKNVKVIEAKGKKEDMDKVLPDDVWRKLLDSIDL